MHDQKKKEKEVLSPEQKAAAAAEHERVGVLYKAVLHTSKAHDYSMKTLDCTESLLMAVPEAYTAYNCRRCALEAVWKQTEFCEAASTAKGEKEEDAATRQEWLRKELKLNSKVLLMNYKNYNAFVHRHWVFDQIEALAKAELMAMQRKRESTSTTSDTDAAPSPTDSPKAPTFALLQQLLQKERAQCEQLLQMDERNFHAWNYRRWVLAQERRANALARTYLPPPSCHTAGAESGALDADDDAAVAAEGQSVAFTTDEAEELAYTTHKIKNNFSNYSAWHQRSLVLKSAAARWQAHLASTEETPSTEETRAACHRALLTQLREDVGFLEQAIYCDPNDQSAWFYAPFVLQLLHSDRQTAGEAAEAAALKDVFVNAVIELIAEVELLGTEDECYIPYYFLLDQFINLQSAPEEDSKAAAARYTDALFQKVPSLTAVANSTENRQRRCFCFLHQRLCKADVLRKGLYDELLKKATQSIG
ncbi:hypothetical protein ABL78_2951 [Leptomonas seymouri]|uniref:Geranylgeranyl transferase type-2 subunit alpha n=1 Tax=Leptomonas seymouri TaxID=5684 RepID=A0A0N1I6W4_LEPSE|nr:hypothetical protein ABL78_2951 [Leptomonas seymouri]|eukprot:KPI87960.1 hypothetical protein ABL78_2951 [Leptomonas seymouri]